METSNWIKGARTLGAEASRKRDGNCARVWGDESVLISRTVLCRRPHESGLLRRCSGEGPRSSSANHLWLIEYALPPFVIFRPCSNFLEDQLITHQGLMLGNNYRHISHTATVFASVWQQESKLTPEDLQYRMLVTSISTGPSIEHADPVVNPCHFRPVAHAIATPRVSEAIFCDIGELTIICDVG